jgi:hypothetical protein
LSATCAELILGLDEFSLDRGAAMQEDKNVGLMHDKKRKTYQGY